MPEIKKTTNYDWFELHPGNRLVRNLDGTFQLRPELVASMRNSGFDPTQPIECERIGPQRLRIYRGHNRYVTARSLGLAIYYIAHPAGSFGTRAPGDDERQQRGWKLGDYVRRGVKLGDAQMIEVEEYCRRTGIGHRAALSLLMGQAAASANYDKAFAENRWRVTDREYAELVASIVEIIARNGKWAYKLPCVNAVSRAVRAKGLDVRRFKEKLRKNGKLLSDQRGTADFMAMFEDVYNYGSKGARYPLAAETENVMRERNFATRATSAAGDAVVH